jgi:hypothetical protein
MSRLILPVFFSLFLNSVLGQETFSKVFDHANQELTDEGKNIEETDFGYIVFDVGFNEDLLARQGVRGIDFQGNSLFFEEHGENNYRQFCGWANSGVKTQDGNFIIGSSAHHISEDSVSNPVLFKISPSGELLDSFRRPSEETTIGHSAIELEDGRYLWIGGTNDTPNGYAGAHLLMFSSEFELEWEQTYLGGGAKSLIGYSAVEVNEGGWIIGCYGWDNSTFGDCEDLKYDSDPVLVKVDADGNEVWREEFGNCTSECGAHVATTTDGNYLFSSCNKTDAPVVQDIYGVFPYVVKFDSNGDTIWERTYGDYNGETVLTKVAELTDGNIFSGGYRYAAGANTAHRWGLLIKLNQQGDSLWYRKYKFADDTQCFFRDVIETSDGGFAACGRTWPSEENSSIDTWVVKTDEYGCIIPGCHIGIEEFTEKYGRFKVGPNPVRQSENLTVFLPDIKDLNGLSFQLRNLSGQLVKSFVPDEGGTSYLLRTNGLAKGMYVLSLLKDGVQVQSEKVVVD